MRFCLNYVPIFSAEDNRAWWSACERLGIERIGFGDTPALARELYVSLTHCALTTKRIRIMPSVTNPITRDPSVTAAALFALSELAPGRVALGIGTGDSAVWGTGLAAARVEMLREYVLAVRGLLAGQTVSYQGRSFRAEWANPDAPLRVPIYVACAGPKVLRTAVEVADGVIVAMGFAEDDLALVRDIAGQRQLEVWWNAPVHLAGNVEAALEAGVNLSASWLTAGGARLPSGYADKLRDLNRDAHDLAFMYKTPARNRILMDRAKELGVYDWLVERSPRLWGSPADVAARLRDLAAQGLTNWVFNLGGVGFDRLGLVEALATEVIPNA